MINTIFNLVPRWCWHNARYMCYTCYSIVCPVCMCAAAWSTVLHAVLHAAQPSQPLYYPVPDWSHTSQHNNNQTYQSTP